MCKCAECSSRVDHLLSQESNALNVDEEVVEAAMDKEKAMDGEVCNEVTGLSQFTAAPTPQLHSSVAEALAESKDKVPQENEKAFADEGAAEEESSSNQLIVLDDQLDSTTETVTGKNAESDVLPSTTISVHSLNRTDSSQWMQNFLKNEEPHFFKQGPYQGFDPRKRSKDNIAITDKTPIIVGQKYHCCHDETKLMMLWMLSESEIAVEKLNENDLQQLECANQLWKMHTRKFILGETLQKEQRRPSSASFKEDKEVITIEDSSADAVPELKITGSNAAKLQETDTTEVAEIGTMPKSISENVDIGFSDVINTSGSCEQISVMKMADDSGLLDGQDKNDPAKLSFEDQSASSHENYSNRSNVDMEIKCSTLPSIDNTNGAAAAELQVEEDDESKANEVEVDKDCDSLMDACGIAFTPDHILADEAQQATYLADLYNRPTRFANRTISVGGRDVTLNAFHYRSCNHDYQVPSNKSSRREYIDEDESCVLYRWELKGALCCRCLRVGIFINDKSLWLAALINNDFVLY